MQLSKIVLALVGVASIAACAPTTSTVEQVGRCIRAQGIEPTGVSGGFYSSGDESVDEAIALHEEFFDLTPSQRAATRQCASQ